MLRRRYARNDHRFLNCIEVTFYSSQHSDRKNDVGTAGLQCKPLQFFTNTLRNYRVKSVNRKLNAVSISLITSDISILSRETPTLSKMSDIKYAS